MGPQPPDGGFEPREGPLCPRDGVVMAPDQRGPTDGARRGDWLNPGVAGVGVASLCSDAGHEMVTSLLPGFVSGTLGGGPAALAAIDGVADALTGLAKLAGGPLASDPQRRGRLAGGGYLGTAVATAAIGLTTALWQVGALRAFAWVSRGVRSPARDMLLTDVARRDSIGRAFGFERAGDNIGAIVGPLLAAALVGLLGVRTTMVLAIVPGVLAAVAITIAARQARRSLADVAGRRRLTLNLGELRQAGLARILAPVACFELGNLATTLLILRATEVLSAQPGWDAIRASSVAILMYAGHNAAAALASLVGGSWVDRLGPRAVFAWGASLYVVAYGVFAFAGGMWLLLAGFGVAGIGIGLAETAESSLIAVNLPAELRSNAFGVLGLTQSVGDIGATVVAGVLWSAFGPQVAFGYAATWMLASVIASRVLASK
ncbi:MAG: MFS transporter [Propionicimonas sp.]